MPFPCLRPNTACRLLQHVTPCQGSTQVSNRLRPRPVPFFPPGGGGGTLRRANAEDRSIVLMSPPVHRHAPFLLLGVPVFTVPRRGAPRLLQHVTCTSPRLDAGIQPQLNPLRLPYLPPGTQWRHPLLVNNTILLPTYVHSPAASCRVPTTPRGRALEFMICFPLSPVTTFLMRRGKCSVPGRGALQ